MPHIAPVLRHAWRFIFVFTFVVSGVSAVIAALLPPMYMATATALPASSMAADKGSVFNSNLQLLYSSLGTADDLDRVVGTAHLDTIYIAAAHALNLPTHYGLKNTESGFLKAAHILKHKTDAAKSEWGELKITVRDGDASIAAAAANNLLQNLQALHQNLQNESNQRILQRLEIDERTAGGADTMKNMAGAKAGGLAPALVAQYKLMLAANPPVLLVVEPARPPLEPTRTTKIAAVLLSFFAAAVVAFLLAVYRHSKSGAI